MKEEEEESDRKKESHFGSSLRRFDLPVGGEGHCFTDLSGVVRRGGLIKHVAAVFKTAYGGSAPLRGQ